MKNSTALRYGLITFLTGICTGLIASLFHDQKAFIFVLVASVACGFIGAASVSEND